MPNERAVKMGLSVLKGRADDHPDVGIYAALLTCLASEAEAVHQAAFELYLDSLEKGIDPQDLGIDDVLVSLDLAGVSDTLVHIDGKVPVEYFNPNEVTLSPDEVRTALMGDDDDDEYDDDEGF